MPLLVSDFDYNLPIERIAQTPIEPRDHSRMLVYDRSTHEVQHRHFYDLPEYLHPNDVLAVNDTRVMPARILGTREDTGGKIEFLLLHRIQGDRWEALAKPARRARKGAAFVFGGGMLRIVVEEEHEEGLRDIRLIYEGIFEEVLSQVGVMPLPPYIHERLKNAERYQTVYAKLTGSVAAPTAGLHFTDELLKRVADRGIQVVPLLLHVGIGTFRPVSVENVDDHVMHEEYYRLSEENAEKLNQARRNGGRIIAVGTTTTRVLESLTDEQGIIHHGEGKTGIFIKPGYTFHGVDALITNFHLPKSTLLMMISALMGREEVLRVYELAVKEEYRFFSFGDSMMIL